MGFIENPVGESSGRQKASGTSLGNEQKQGSSVIWNHTHTLSLTSAGEGTLSLPLPQEQWIWALDATQTPATRLFACWVLLPHLQLKNPKHLQGIGQVWIIYLTRGYPRVWKCLRHVAERDPCCP